LPAGERRTHLSHAASRIRMYIQTRPAPIRKAATSARLKWASCRACCSFYVPYAALCYALLAVIGATS